MSKIISVFSLMLVFAATVTTTTSCAQKSTKVTSTTATKKVMKKSIYDYKATDINGKTFDFSTLKGKKIIIVNTASKCGYTGQYDGLEKLYKEYGKDGLVIIGFPTNDFNGQEPGTNAEIASFCKLNYGVTFPMMEKITVKGDDMNPIYRFLTQKDQNGFEDSKVMWNFQKYLINRDGQLEKVLMSKVEPNDPEIINWIKA